MDSTPPQQYQDYRAPLTELWTYRKKEKAKDAILQEADFDPSFLVWARSYLGSVTFSRMLATGESILDAIYQGIRTNLSAKAAFRQELRTIQRGAELRAGVNKIIKISKRSFCLRTKLHLAESYVPYCKEDAVALKQLHEIEMQFRVEFVPVGPETRSTLAYPLACSTDPCYGLRIEVKYQVEREQQIVPLTVYTSATGDPHTALCHMNSIADLVSGRSYEWTRSKPHRLIPAIWKPNRGGKVRQMYTPCCAAGCTTCDGIVGRGYHRDVQNGYAVLRNS